MALSALTLADQALGGGVLDRRVLRSLGTFLVELQRKDGPLFPSRVLKS
jgi:hypothetical protein